MREYVAPANAVDWLNVVFSHDTLVAVRHFLGSFQEPKGCTRARLGIAIKSRAHALC